MIKPHGAEALNPLLVTDPERHAALMAEAESLPSKATSSRGVGVVQATEPNSLELIVWFAFPLGLGAGLVGSLFCDAVSEPPQALSKSEIVIAGRSRLQFGLFE